MNPQEATLYGGQPFLLTVTGAQMPYTLSSSEPSLLPVPQQMNGNTVQLLPFNPGVVDANLQPGELPARTTKIAVRAANGQVLEGTYKVAVNSLFGYKIDITSTTCGTTATGTAIQACAGGESLVSFLAVTNGVVNGNRQYKFEVIKGDFEFVTYPQRVLVGNQLVTQTDHNGLVQVIIRGKTGVDSQIAVLRVYDVPTGAYMDVAFPLTAIKGGVLAIVPDKLTFTGNLTTECGTGQGDVFVFDGKPPYTAASSDPNIFVNDTSTTQPGKFTIRAVNPGTCLDGAVVVITDTLGARGTVTVDTARGTTTVPDLSVSPATMTLVCGTSGSAIAIGGRGTYFTSSSHPRVTAVVSGNIVTITRPVGDGATVYPTTATVNVSDGTKISPITVTVPANCP